MLNSRVAEVYYVPFLLRYNTLAHEACVDTLIFIVGAVGAAVGAAIFSVGAVGAAVLRVELQLLELRLLRFLH